MNDIFEKLYDKMKEDYSFYAITIWIIYGVFRIYFQARHLVYPIIYFGTGIFIAAILAVFPYIVMRIVSKSLVRLKVLNDSYITLISWLLFIFDTAYIIICAHYFIELQIYLGL